MLQNFRFLKKQNKIIYLLSFLKLLKIYKILYKYLTNFDLKNNISSKHDEEKII